MPKQHAFMVLIFLVATITIDGAQACFCETAGGGRTASSIQVGATGRYGPTLHLHFSPLISKSLSKNDHAAIATQGSPVIFAIGIPFTYNSNWSLRDNLYAAGRRANRAHILAAWEGFSLYQQEAKHSQQQQQQ